MPGVGGENSACRFLGLIAISGPAWVFLVPWGPAAGPRLGAFTIVGRTPSDPGLPSVVLVARARKQRVDGAMSRHARRMITRAERTTDARNTLAAGFIDPVLLYFFLFLSRRTLSLSAPPLVSHCARVRVYACGTRIGAAGGERDDERNRAPWS